MKIIKARDLYEKLSIIEETSDHWGRKGRGIDIVYFNKKYENTQYIPYEEFKKAVLEFEKYLNEEVWVKEENIIFHKFREIFGNLKK